MVQVLESEGRIKGIDWRDYHIWERTGLETSGELFLDVSNYWDTNVLAGSSA